MNEFRRSSSFGSTCTLIWPNEVFLRCLQSHFVVFYSPSISVVSIGTGWISPYRSPHAGTSAKQAPFDDYSVMKHWRTRNSSKTKSRNNREGEKRENPKAVRCGKCADRGDSYCKLNPSPVPCMTTRSCWDRSVLLTYPASLRGLLNPQLPSSRTVVLHENIS